MWGLQHVILCELLHVAWGLLLCLALLYPTWTIYSKLSEKSQLAGLLTLFCLLLLYFSLAVLWHVLEDYMFGWF